jgi:hypothetical protein
MGIYIALTVMVKQRDAETSMRMRLTTRYNAPECINQRQVRDFAIAAVADVTASVFPATDDGRARLFILWFWLPLCSVDGSSSMFVCSSVSSTSNVKNFNIWMAIRLLICVHRHASWFYRPNNNLGKKHIIFPVVLK